MIVRVVLETRLNWPSLSTARAKKTCAPGVQPVVSSVMLAWELTMVVSVSISWSPASNSPSALVSSKKETDVTVPSRSITPLAVRVTVAPASVLPGEADSEVKKGALGPSSTSRSSVPNALSRPPVATRPLSDASESVPCRMAALISATVASGATDQANAATPATCGVAMLVPENEAYLSPGKVL